MVCCRQARAAAGQEQHQAMVQSDAARGIAILAFLEGLTVNGTYAQAIPSSYDVSVGLDGDEALSGMIVAGAPSGYVVACVLVLVMARCCDIPYRTTIGTAAFCNSLACALYCACAAAPIHSIAMVIAARVLIGACNGAIDVLVLDMLKRILAPANVVAATSAMSFGVVVGLGCAPMLSSAVLHMLLHQDCDNQTAQIVSGGSPMLPFGLMFFATIIFLVPPALHTGSPLITTAATEESGSESFSSAAELVLWHERKWAALGCILVCFCVQYLVQSLEVGSPLLLQEIFDWSSSNIGMATGASVVSAVPLMSLNKIQIHAAADCDEQLRRCFQSMLSGVASVLLLLATGSFGCCPWLVMLVSDTLFYTFTIPVLAELGATMLNMSVPSSALWSTRNMVLVMGLTRLARSAAGPVSRWFIGAGGLDAFAWLQVGVALFTALAYKWFVMPQIAGLMDNNPTSSTSLQQQH
eukprot:NODE_7528_length_1570_cov_9.726265.p1 GENE.NODE_7528_length_1570_cov_9.726265~~NODE_7528_length_1570_cov_9.726265.p1  ORF type:complete len:485 (-),score=79.06 NODE_7528_length_1570_cov_9.726265:114-1517(-)